MFLKNNEYESFSSGWRWCWCVNKCDFNEYVKRAIVSIEFPGFDDNEFEILINSSINLNFDQFFKDVISICSYNQIASNIC